MNLLYQSNSALTHPLDLIKDTPDFPVLSLQVLDEPIDPLEILVPVDVFGHGVPLLLHKFEDLLLVGNLLDGSLELLLQILDLVLLVAVLNTLVRDFLLGKGNLLVDWLLVLLPLLFELLEFVVDLTYFSLEDAHILSLQLGKFSQHFLLLFDDFLARFQILCKVFLFLFQLILLLLKAFSLNLTLADFGF